MISRIISNISGPQRPQKFAFSAAIAAVAISMAVSSCGGGGGGGGTTSNPNGGTSPTPTPNGTATPISSPTPTATPTPTPNGTATPIGSPTATPTASPTATPTGSPTATPTTTPTVSPTTTPTVSPTATPVPSATPTPGNFTVSGRITDQSGNPLAGYTVEMNNHSADSGVTNSSGVFTLTGSTADATIPDNNFYVYAPGNNLFDSFLELLPQAYGGGVNNVGTVAVGPPPAPASKKRH